MLATARAQKNKAQKNAWTRWSHIRELPATRSVRIHTLACFLAMVADNMAIDDATRMPA